MSLAKRPCPLCGKDTVEMLADLEFSDFDSTTLDRRTRVVACISCGQVYNDSDMTAASLEGYYRDETLYAAEMGVGSGGDSHWDLMRYAGTLKALVDFIPGENALLVDAGCAKGGFLSYLRGQGYTNLCGVDINPECVTYLRETLNIPAEVGTLYHLPFEDQQADVLIYSHVLEHVPDLFQVLSEAHRVLRDDGILFVELPDATRYAKFSVSSYYWLSQREHINHFDTAHIQMLLTSAGFEPIENGTMLMNIATDVLSPLIYSVCRKRPGSPSMARIHFQGELCEAVRHYITTEEALIAPLCRQVDTILAGRRPIYIWGIGLEFFSLYVQTGLNRCTVKGLVDKNPRKQERTVDGMPIHGPECFEGAPDDSVVIITSALHAKTMQQYLHDIGFGGEVVVLA